MGRKKRMFVDTWLATRAAGILAECILMVAGSVWLAACGPSRDRDRAKAGETAAVQTPSPPTGPLGPCQFAPGMPLTGDGIGALRVGVPVVDVKAACPVLQDTTELYLEGLPERILRIRLGTDTVDAEIDDERVWRITVHSRGGDLRTADSIGIGTPIARLLAIPGIRAITGENRVYVLSPRHCGISFGLSDTGLDAPPPTWTDSALRRLPPTTMVEAMLLVGCRT